MHNWACLEMVMSIYLNVDGSTGFVYLKQVKSYNLAKWELVKWVEQVDEYTTYY